MDSIVLANPESHVSIFKRTDGSSSLGATNSSNEAPDRESKSSLDRTPSSGTGNRPEMTFLPYVPPSEQVDIEKIVWVFHGNTDKYTFATVADTRTPFAFLEAVGTLQPGVRRCVGIFLEGETGIYGYMMAFNYWLTDGRSTLIAWIYEFKQPVWSEKHFFLVSQYPTSRYPIPSDVLESLVWQDCINCQYCLARGYEDCECVGGIKRRLNVREVPTVNPKDPYKIWAWVWGVVEAGLKKYTSSASNNPKAITLKGSIFTNLTPTFANGANIHKTSYQNYLTSISPFFQDTMVLHRYLSHNARSSGIKIRSLLNTDYHSDRSERSEEHRSLFTKSEKCLIEELDQHNQLIVWNEGENETYPDHPLKKRRLEDEHAKNSQYQPSTGGLLSPQRTLAWGLPPTTMDIGYSVLGSNPQDAYVAHWNASIQQETLAPQETRQQFSDLAQNELQQDEDEEGDENDESGNEDKHRSQSGDAGAGHSRDPNEPDEEDRKRVMQILDELDKEHWTLQSREPCKLCGTSGVIFSRKHDLKRHIKAVHLVERNFECSVCGAKFARRQHLDTHNKAVHLKASVYKCAFCPKVYTAESTRKKHLLKAHKAQVYMQEFK